jgi:VanZ family protein
MTFIFCLSSVPQFPVQIQDPWASYVSYGAHIFLYFVLTFFLVRAFNSAGMTLKKSLVWAFLIAVLYGATDEFHQSYVPYRSMDIKDWLVDIVSALAVVYLYNYIYKLKMFK